MQDFYRLREAKSDTTKAEALRQAQLRLLRGETTLAGAAAKVAQLDRKIVHEEKPEAANKPPFTPDPKRPYAHPYYWAPFILIGNWK
jgi:CHAT domain-containing protein